MTASPKAGNGAIKLTSKVGKKKLRPGKYKITVLAKNAVGRTTAVVLKLKILA